MITVLAPSNFTGPLATLREHLDLEVAQSDDHGRYVFEFEVMSELVDALDEIERSLAESQAEDDDR